jgi:hypothetical protein
MVRQKQVCSSVFYVPKIDVLCGAQVRNFSFINCDG